jgi:hypothetical protein
MAIKVASGTARPISIAKGGDRRPILSAFRRMLVSVGSCLSWQLDRGARRSPGMGWKDRWPEWQVPHEAGSLAERRGTTQLAFFEAGLIDGPDGWGQCIEVCWDQRLKPQSPEYDPEFVARAEWGIQAQRTSLAWMPSAAGRQPVVTLGRTWTGRPAAERAAL